MPNSCRINWIIVAILSGALLVFGFAPTHVFFLGYLCPATLLYIWINSGQRSSFWYGLFFGLGFFGTGCSWIFISIHKYGNANLFLSIFITTVFVLVLAIFPAIMGYVFRRFFKRTPQTMQCLVVFPALWVVFEWLRAWVFTGFPWLFLGYTQTNFVLKEFAPIFSVYGVSLVVAIIAGLVVYFCHNLTYWRRFVAVSAAIAFCIVAWGLSFIQWTRPVGKPIKVSLVQGNIPLSLKWNNEYLFHIIQTYTNETHQHWNSKIILWPEAAIPAVTQQVAEYLHFINEQGLKRGDAVIFGLPTYNPKSKAYYNSIKVLGDGAGTYNKRHLVPFGEYTPLGFIFKPLMDRLKIPMSGFTKGAYNQKLLTAVGLKIAPFICYEVAFPHEVMRFAKGSNLIVTVSDDSWFGQSFASPQQLQMAQLRALETARPILYGTNNGITAVITPNGNIKERLPRNRLATLTTTVQPVEGETLAMRWHNLLIGALVLLMLLSGLIFRKKERRVD